MSLLWVTREYVALASAVLEGTFSEYGTIDDSLEYSCAFEDLHYNIVSTSTLRPRKEPETESP